MNEPKCPNCSSNEIQRAGVYTRADGQRSQRYKCKRCRKNFRLQYLITPAQPIGKICPKCNSPNTIKYGKPVERKHGLAQPCICKDCGKYFTLGGRKQLMLFLNGKLIHSCWDPPGLIHIPDVICPNCNQKKAILKTEYQDKRTRKICLACGQQFRGKEQFWKPTTYRMLGKIVPLRPWQFEDDLWDLRELYPNVNEYELTHHVFLNFSNLGSAWFKELVKKHICWLTQLGIKSSTLIPTIYRFGFLGRFLDERNLTSMKEVNRELLGTYWAQERGKLSRESLKADMNSVKKFLDWGNAEQHFITPATLITTFDRPRKSFKDEPEPLEESVLKAIRDNLHILPEPLQLMFMLGFWLGARLERTLLHP